MFAIESHDLMKIFSIIRNTNPSFASITRFDETFDQSIADKSIILDILSLKLSIDSSLFDFSRILLVILFSEESSL